MKKIRTILTILLTLVFLFSVGMMARQQLLYRKTASESNEAAQIAGLSERSGPPPVQQQGPDVSSEEPVKALPAEAADLANIDLEALRAVNEDVVGWIEIPGTELSYPLVQGTDDQYYLSHNWKGEGSGGGSVYLASFNGRELTDFHTIVYAHRMRNDSMFGLLKHYEDLGFWQEHPCVYIVTEAGVHRYEIFAALEAGVKSIIYQLNIEEAGLQADLIYYGRSNSTIDTQITPSVADRVLTLSTCTTGNVRAKRWVVQTVLQGVWS